MVLDHALHVSDFIDARSRLKQIGSFFVKEPLESSTKSAGGKRKLSEQCGVPRLQLFTRTGPAVRTVAPDLGPDAGSKSGLRKCG